MLDGEPTLKERVIAFFKGAPRRYSFAPEMDPAARAWLREYKKLFDEVARLNSGNNVAEDLNSGFGIQNSESSGTATKVPEKVIKKIGKIVEDSDNSPKKIIKLGQIVENAQKTPLTNIDQGNMQVSGERSAIYYPKFTEQDIENNINDIALMESVKDIPEDKLKKTGKKPRDLYEEFFESLGYNIHSSVFGDIELSKASAKSEIRHGLTAEKIASIEAIPEVIEKGKVIMKRIIATFYGYILCFSQIK